MTRTPLVTGLIGMAFCLIGILPMPYSYYSTLRFIVLGVCVVLAGCAILRRQGIATWWTCPEGSGGDTRLAHLNRNSR